MLYLYKNTTNPISVDAPQMVSIATPFYFFEFEDIQLQQFYTGYVDRLNPSSDRFGQFEIVVPTDFDLESGQYIYKVFQSADEVETDTDNMTLLEQGMCTVFSTTETNDFYNAPTLTGTAYVNS